MAHPLPLATALDEARMDFESMWRRARVDGLDAHEEEALFAFYGAQVAPKTATATATLSLIGTLARASDGLDSPRVVRTCREWWARRGRNVIRLTDELPLDAA